MVVQLKSLEHKMNYCDYHKAVLSENKRNTDDIQRIWKEISAMKYWVIAGMGSLVIQLVIFIGTKLIH
jgi:hypothetical protein